MLAITNGSAFSTVGMERYITGYSKEAAAIVNAFNGIPVLYEPGFNLAHRFVYGESQHTTLQSLGFPATLGKALDETIYDPIIVKIKKITGTTTE